ncbi:MAG: FAD binding domain-containing protein [Xanthomonadales bacterium]|nr:FAD binding domain-containing protein [Xanthomonadales bacterium]
MTTSIHDPHAATPAFELNGRRVELAGSDPAGSLLRWLKRQRLHGTKEGCGDGDCGACTVALIETDADGRSHYRAVNSCLLPMGSVVGREILTVEALADGDVLHPAQQALVDHSGSQCGYCTPGFVMSLFAGVYGGELNDHTTEGNLCRCTGYAPIRRATAELATLDFSGDRFAEGLRRERHSAGEATLGNYFSPVTIDDALRLKQQHPDAAWIAGATDLGVNLSRGQVVASSFIALDRIAELQQIEKTDGGWRIGAGVSLSRLESELGETIPALGEMLRWFAARQVRNRATVGGNLGSASPIGDLSPLLLALDATIELRGPKGSRQVPVADFFTGYRQTIRADDELIVAVDIPVSGATCMAYKVAKRQSDDISIVAAVFAIQLDEARCVRHARLAYGGVAATPVRATGVEDFLLGKLLDATSVEMACTMLLEAFTPLSDHRAGADYRRALCASLFDKFVAEQLS